MTHIEWSGWLAEVGAGAGVGQESAGQVGAKLLLLVSLPSHQ